MELETEIVETVPAETEQDAPETAPVETEPREASEETLPAETESENAETAPAETEQEESSEESETEMESLEGEEIPFYSYMELSETEEVTEVTDTEAIVQAINQQTEVIHEGFSGLGIGVGLLVGITLVQGFRLRRI